MSNWKEFFKGKRVTLMGLGLLGRGAGDAVFLAEHGAELIVTDIRDAEILASSLAKLKKYKNIQYVLGEHRLEDFRNRDFILKAAGIPLDSPFIAEAEKNRIPIEMDASLFAKLMPEGVTLVGVTGTRGKSTTTALIFDILSLAKSYQLKAISSVYRGGNLVPEATLPLLEEVRAGDIVVLELDSWQLQGFHDARISPQVAVFTTFLDDHLTYYKGDTDRYFEDKVAIFKYQKKGDILIIGEQVVRTLRKGLTFVTKDSPLRKPFVACVADIPADWRIPLPGEHNLENIACALAVAKHFGMPEAAVQKAVENFKAIPGRLEFLREVNGVKIYNDNNSTTPDATIAGLRALNPKSEIRNPKQSPNPQSLNAKRSTLNAGAKRIVLIMGGTDKGLDMSKLVTEIPRHCKAVILLRETGTEKLKRIMNYELGITIEEREMLKECVDEAMKIAQKGDIVLFSPAFAAFGKWCKNEYDRGEQFVTLIDKLIP